MANADTETQPAPELGYTLWAVFRRNDGDQQATSSGDSAATELAGTVETLTPRGITLRGFYDVSAFRRGRRPPGLAPWQLRRVSPGCLPAASPHHAPLLAPADLECHGRPPRGRVFPRAQARLPPRRSARRWLTVYPFVRSYDWYILPPEERSAMLAEHGRKGAAFKSVLTNTVAAFGLGDYEWILPLEADELVDLVDVMRALRATQARLHVREEIPFFTGRRIGVEEIAAILS